MDNKEYPVKDLIIIGKREAYDKQKYYRLDVTSRNTMEGYKEALSPFYLGPVNCYNGLTANIMENAWQFSKVYPCHADNDGNPTEEYFKWRDEGWKSTTPQRHPMKKQKPLYSYWEKDGQVMKLGYIEARKKIYVPLYAQAFLHSSSPYGLEGLQKLASYNCLALADFDGYNHRKLGMTYYDVLNDPTRIMGHGFVLGMILHGFVYEQDGEIIVDEEAMKMIEY